MSERVSSNQAATCFMQYHGFVRAMAMRYAPWPGLVDDIAQQVFIEYMSGADRWDYQVDLRPLLMTITRRTATQCWKKALNDRPEHVRRLAEYIRQKSERHDNSVEIHEELEALRNCIKRLPDESRTLLDWYYFQEISTVDIGERLQLTREAVQRAISRVRDKLRKCVGFATQNSMGGADV